MYIKKLILFLFLIPILASAQKTTGANYTYVAQRYEWLAGVFKALGLPAGAGPAAFQAGQEMRAGALYYDSTGIDSGLYIWSGSTWISVGAIPSLQEVTDIGNTTNDDIILSGYDGLAIGDALAKLNSTGLISDGLLTINGGDNTKFDLAAGTGMITDYATSASAPTINKISWSSFIAQTVTNIASADKTYIMIDGTGAITQQTTFPTQIERRQKIFIGAIVHPNHSTIQNARTVPDFTQGSASQMYDFFDALGAFSVDGNRISANGANLSFNKTAGHIFRRGANYQGNDQNPHIATLAAGTPQSFIKATVNAQVGGSVTVVDPANYDVGGTVTAIPGGPNTSTVQRVYAFSSGLIFVQYGQVTYSSLSAAISGISNEAFTINPAIADGGVLLAYIVLTKGCADLSDASQASILPAPRFDAGIGGGSSAVTNLQQAYNNSVTPQITTTTALGSVDIKRGSASDADAVMKIMNGAGTAVTTFTGTGPVLNALMLPSANNTIDLGATATAFKDIYSYSTRLKGATSGELTLVAAATAGTNTITFPANTGTVALLSTSNIFTSTNTFNNNVFATGGFFTNSTSIGSNFQVQTAAGTTSGITQAEYLPTGVGAIRFRVGMRGTTAAQPVANESVSNIIMGRQAITEFTSGNHDLFAGLSLLAPTITGGVATVSNTAMLYIDAPMTATVSGENSSIWVRSGNVRLGTAGTSIGTMSFEGNTSGKVILTPAAAAGTPTLTFPTISGTFALTTDLAVRTKNINLSNPGSAENEFIFFTPVPITVTNTRTVLVGSASPSVTYNIAFGTDRTTLTNVYTAGQTVTSTTTGTDASGVNDNTIPSNSWVVITTSAQSGTVTQLNTSITYTVD